MPVSTVSQFRLIGEPFSVAGQHWVSGTLSRKQDLIAGFNGYSDCS
jgi:hypothetical protein